MGRSRKYKQRVGLTVGLEASEFEALEDIRWREHKDISEVIRLACQDYIKAHGAGNETFRLDNWQSNPDFRAVPTILSDNERWRSHLKDCNRDEKLKLLKQANMIRSQIISVGLDKRVRKI